MSQQGQLPPWMMGAPGTTPGAPAFPSGMPGMPPFGMPPMMPFPGLPPRMPMLPHLIGKAPNGGNQGVDPNNDITCWSEHKTEDGRKYWFNKVTMVSTHDKPFCLKTPEERSIPPCPWKEYSADGKVYYSNGKESIWTMPEEYRIWKEKVDALEKSKSTKSDSKSHGKDSEQDKSKSSRNANSNTASSSSDNAASEKKNVPTYATTAEAFEAFKELLQLKNVSATAKMKEAQDLCQHDPRWEALKTQGEKKQALAEYQTKKLKMEKEALKVKARKQKDAFLLMLAENTDIDIRTRWKDAIESLKDDIRYKNIENQYEREDLFNEFIGELDKKEREDRIKQKENVLTMVKNWCNELSDEGKLTYKTHWQDIRSIALTKLTELTAEPSKKSLIEEHDIRRVVNDKIYQLEQQYKADEKKKKDLFHAQQTEFGKNLSLFIWEKLIKTGKMSVYLKYREFSTLPALIHSESFQELFQLYASNTVPGSEKDENARSSSQPRGDRSREGSHAFPSSGMNKAEEEFDQHLHAIYNSVLNALIEEYKNDKKLIKRVLYDHHVMITHDYSYAQFKNFILNLCHLEDATPVESTETNNVITFVKAKSIAPPVANTEEGEIENENEEGEITVPADDGATAAALLNPLKATNGISATVQELETMLLSHPYNLYEIYQDLHEKAVVEYEEEMKHQAKLEQKYLSLLKETFYLSDHVGMKWEDAKSLLSRRSAYEALNKNDRKRLFQEYMATLESKMNQLKAMKTLQLQQQQYAMEEGEEVNVQNEILIPRTESYSHQKRDTYSPSSKKRERSLSEDDHAHSSKQSRSYQ